MRRMLTLCALAATVWATAQPAAQQTGTQAPEVTFKVEINYVEVDAIVTDGSGRPVTDLEKSDFQVLEDGQPQQITTFALVDVPVERADRPLFTNAPVETDVATNRTPFEGRVYVIVLDELHTAPLRSAQVKQAARQFVERYMGDNDLAAVIHTGGRTDASQEFTGNKRLLLQSIDRFMGQKLRSRTLERLDEYQRMRSIPQPEGDQSQTRINDPLDMQRGYHARNTLNTLARLSEYLAGIRGRRKALVLFSEGIDYNIANVFDNREATDVLAATREAIAAATRANVSFYTVDPRGLTTSGDELIEAGGGFPENPHLGLTPQSFQDDLRLAQDSLRTLGEETGGFAVVNQNEFNEAFERLVRESSTYYVLGYYSSNDRRDGRFRKIDVKVDRPGLEVRHRKGYAAPRGKQASDRALSPGQGSPEIRDALQSPLPLSGLRMSVTADPLRGGKGNADVGLTTVVHGGSLPFEEKDGKFHNELEIATVAIDQNGRMQPGERHVLNMPLSPQSRERVQSTGVRVVSRMSLPPGRYQLRVAGRERVTGRVGSLTYDLEVPKFDEQPLSMSGILLTSAASQLLVTPKNDELLKPLLPAPPTTEREFVRQDVLALYAEVYDAQGTKPHHVDITTSVLADDGRVVVTNTDTRSSTDLQGKRGGYGVTGQVPLKDLQPGLYVLKVEAQSRGGDRPTTMRQVPFRVVG